MIAYASRAGTRRNLAALRASGWRLMVSAKGVLRTEDFPYALDNGAWWSHVNGRPFDEDAFMLAYEKLAAGADFIVLPDVVSGGLESLKFSLRWRERLGAPRCLQMLAVQDGMEVRNVEPLVGPDLGIFVGGSTEWKEATMPLWGKVAARRNAWVHVGRVNTARRARLAAASGMRSFDGSGPSRFQTALAVVDNARRQKDLFSCLIE